MRGEPGGARPPRWMSATSTEQAESDRPPYDDNSVLIRGAIGPVGEVRRRCDGEGDAAAPCGRFPTSSSRRRRLTPQVRRRGLGRLGTSRTSSPATAQSRPTHGSRHPPPSAVVFWSGCWDVAEALPRIPSRTVEVVTTDRSRQAGAITIRDAQVLDAPAMGELDGDDMAAGASRPHPTGRLASTADLVDPGGLSRRLGAAPPRT